MEKVTILQAKKILKKYSKCTKDYGDILKHSIAVMDFAIEIAKKIKKNSKKEIDINFIKSASLLHDIGRTLCPPKTKESIKHGIAGAKILRKEKLPKHARVAERHIGAGIWKQDIIDQKLPLPLKDYVPKTIEEEIIAYADNRIHHKKRMSSEWVVQRFKKEVNEQCAQKIVALNKKIEGLMK